MYIHINISRHVYTHAKEDPIAFTSEPSHEIAIQTQQSTNLFTWLDLALIGPMKAMDNNFG